jgi:diguanylate cyclase (GGDEF)-like protein
LAALPGISKLGTTSASPHTLALEDGGGVPLAAILQRERLGVATVLDLALALAETVGALHRLGVAHRDINPANILLRGPQRRPVIIDFDIASSFAEERPAFTAQSEIAGTLAYIAPEQTGRTGHVLDRRADLYSLGATLYELATGKTPFEGDDAFGLIRDHLVRIPTPPAERDARVPQAFSDIVMRLLQKEPDRRYQSAEGLARDIRTLVERRARGEGDAAFALAEHDFPQRLLPPSRLVGRERELEALRTAFDDAVAGRGNALLISGAPGVGKTTLVNELRSIVAASGGWFVTGKFDQYRRDIESDAVRKALRSLIGMLLTEPEEELVPLRARLLRAMGANAALAAAMLPELAVLFDLAPDLTLSDPFSAPGRLAKVGADILRCIASSARPVVFVIDDLQWASATPLGFLEAAIGDTKSRGLLLVGSYRAAEVDAAHPLATMLSRYERASMKPRKLFLNDLQPAELGALLEEMLRLTPGRAHKLAAAVGARTGGNPYDTVELINALRREGVLTAGDEGWTWDDATIRRYVGEGDVVDLLSARIDALPAQSRALLETAACLGGEVSLELLQVAGGLSTRAMQERLAPAFDDGLILFEQRTGTDVCFRHDRVQQAAYLRIKPEARIRLRLALARRLCAAGKFETVAAEQYLHAARALRDPDECLRVVALFREAGLRAGLTASYAVAERFFATALTLLASLSGADDTLIAALRSELHATLYALGRLEDADTVYASIERRGGGGSLPIDSACVQISSLTNRNKPREAVALGLRLLTNVGLAPPERSDLEASNEARLSEIYRWCDDEAARTADLSRTDISDVRLLGAAKLLNRMIPAAYFCDQAVLAWLVLESFRLWQEHGPCPILVGPMSHAGLVASAIRDDYRIGYRVALRIITICEAHRYEAETSHARFVFSVGTAHWFDALERCVTQARLAREELLRSGDLQNACLTFYASIPLLLECSQTLEELSTEVEAGLALCVRTGNHQAANSYVVHRQLVRALRGETEAVGHFTDASFDERAHLAALGADATATIYYHETRALAALLFGDAPALLRHAGVAHSLLRHIPGIPPTALTQVLQAVALAWRARDATSSERSALLAELDRCQAWSRRRADDAPANFLHSVRLIEAERAWTHNDFTGASAAFEAALELVRDHGSPRHRAFIAERAGRFYLEHRLRRYGEILLRDARESYERWGATAKVRALERDYPFLIAADLAEVQQASPTTLVSSETIDLIGILRASQALSSQTSLAQLKARVVELLAALTGATAVLLVLRRDDQDDWFLTSGDDGATESVEQAGMLGQLPLTAFRYVERTRGPLLIADALRDDRFSRDPYFADCDRCSMLVVPILSQGEPRAVLLLENRLSRDAFNPARLDSVMLIAGQLAVSLDNALLYASLERKVAERTEALAEANRKLGLLSLTDALTGLVNRRGFDEKLAAEWSRATRSGSSLGLAMIDVDEFKSYNDYYGHPAGDACLRRVGKTLSDGIRPGADIAARYGGEEFALILPDTELAGTHAAAERLRAAVANLGEPSAAAKHGIVTISIGIVAFVPTGDTSAQRYLEAADAALYRAKRLGRNCVAEAAGATVALEPSGGFA